MRIVCTILILSFCSYFPLSASGQDLNRKGTKEDTVQQYINAADEFFKEGRYYAAADLYGKALVREESAYTLHQLAEANRLGRFYNFSELWYEELANKYPDAYRLTYYWYGMMLKANGGKYDEASSAFREFLRGFISDDASTSEKYTYYIKNAKKEIQTCEMAKEFQEQPKELRVYNIGNEINKKESEFGAVQRNDSTLIFTGSNMITTHKIKKFGFIKTGESFDTVLLNRLYKSKKKGQYWQERNIIFLPLNNRSQDVGSPAQSPIADIFYITMCKGSYGKKQCHIYASQTPEPGKWLRPQKLPKHINPKKTSSKNPMLVVDNAGDTILYFSSNREGSIGQYDIWYSKMVNGAFQDPVNAGDQINTSKDEVSPFYDAATSTLYFSSDGHPSMGEFDIYKVEGNTQAGWDSVYNLGSPINGPTDDYYFAIYHDEQKITGYFSSNRSGGFSQQGTCCDDIYFFEKSLLQKIFIKGALVEAKSQQPITSANIKLKVENNDSLFKEEKLTGNHQFLLSSGKNYSDKVIYFNASNYMGESIRLADFKKNISGDTLDLKTIELKSLQMPTIYYSYNRAKIPSKYTSDLDQLAKQLNNNEDKYLVVASHTDNIDSKQFNIRLSKKRTQQVINYLIEKGVDRSQLIGQWYGEFKPAVPNQTEQGADNPSARAKNRRTTFEWVTSKEGIPTGQVLSAPATASAGKTPAADLKLDQLTAEQLLKKYGDQEKEGLAFKIQVGAFQHPDKNMFSQLTQYGKLSKDVTPAGITKFMIGEVATLNEAHQLKDKIRAEIPGAWVVAYHNNKRINMLQAIELLGTD